MKWVIYYPKEAGILLRLRYLSKLVVNKIKNIENELYPFLAVSRFPYTAFFFVKNGNKHNTLFLYSCIIIQLSHKYE